MIEIRNLSKRYDGFEAVRNISFTVEKGDIFGFIGPNGAGKTTTIRILTTLLDPTAGDVRVDGHSILEEPYEVRKAVGFMPDLFGVYDRVTVWEYLDFFGSAYGLPRRTRHRMIEDILRLTDLDTVRERQPVDLSKGMKQRLCLAKTLIHDPKVLVLDEPASGLDPRARIEFRALLKELRELGKTIFLSSHILTELSDVCNAVAILEKGRLIAAGSISSILERMQPKRAFVLTLLERAEEAAKALSAGGPVSGVRVEGSAVHFHLEGDLPALAGLVRSLAAQGLPIVGLQETRQDLEDLFMQLTRGEVA